MRKHFMAADLKVQRAKYHLQELKTKIDQFFRNGGAEVVFEIAPEFETIGGSRTGSFTYRKREPIPSEWPAIIGDILHNLRSSLDLIACELHRITGGPPEEIRGVQYPFCTGKSDLAGEIKKRRLNRIGGDFREIIENTAPYIGGNDGLCAIHDLDILDKHRIIVPAIAIVAFDWPVPITSGHQKFATGIVKDGQRLMIFPETLFPHPQGPTIKVEFSIVFGDVDVFRGRNVVLQLQACLESIELILDHFEAAAEKAAHDVD
jgi:hypothetical protein